MKRKKKYIIYISPSKDKFLTPSLHAIDLSNKLKWRISTSKTDFWEEFSLNPKGR